MIVWVVRDAREIRPGIYRHYKGNLYEVLGEASHSETQERLVVYQALYGRYDWWVRPKSMFMEMVLIEGQEVPRFKYVDEKSKQE